jgi:hypothetical protein
MTALDPALQDHRPPALLNLRVFLASPGHVAAERALARQVFDD